MNYLTESERRDAQKQFYINRARVKYGNRFDYSKVNYINAKNTVIIKCNKHNNEFTTTLGRHIVNSGCKDCMRELIANNQNDFITKAKKLNGDRYDYSKVDYKASNEPVVIICKKHGKFRQRPANHLHGQHCKKCVLERLNKGVIFNPKSIDMSKEERLNKLKNRYPNCEFRNYVHYELPMEVYCKIHNKIWNKTPHAMLRPDGCACKICNRILTKTQEFINKAIKKHGIRFDYSKFDITEKRPIIICKKHGEFRQEKRNHLAYDICCPICIKDSKAISKEEFIKRANMKFFNRYDYSKVDYKDLNTSVIIICPEHGEFNKIPAEHIRMHRNGKINLSLGGCPICYNRSDLEIKVSECLLRNNISNISQYKILDYRFRWDFYIPNLNLLIEIDDDCHKHSKQTIKNDILKDKLAKDYGYHLERIKATTQDEVEHILDNLEIVLKKYCKYRVNDQFFKDFKSFSTYLNLSYDASSDNYKCFEFKLK